MILNNLDSRVAQFPEELVTYGGNGQVRSDFPSYPQQFSHFRIRPAARPGALQLGAVLDRDAIPLHDVGRADPRHVLRPPDGAVSLDAREPADDNHERDGGAQLLVARGLRSHVRLGGDNVRTVNNHNSHWNFMHPTQLSQVWSNDGRQLLLHRTAGDSARNDGESVKCIFGASELINVYLPFHSCDS